MEKRLWRYQTGMLAKLIDAGLIWLDDQTYVGRASDGVVVQFGLLGMDEQHIEHYLSDYPGPENW
jgi:hypothetical protein